jgi:CBS domain-containing protein
MDRETDRFLSAFSAIEQHLRELIDAAEHHPFSELVHEAGHSHGLVRRLSGDLRKLAELRNFLVHRYEQRAPLAVPSDVSLTKIEQIRDALLKPATLHSLFHKVVHCCRPDESIGLAAETMHRNNVSLLPVYEGKAFVGLLTAETLARWLAARLATGVGLVEEEPVAEVLKFQDNDQPQEFASHRSTVTDAFNMLERHYHRGRPLCAILLTPNGNRRELPTGIVTAGDFPVMLEAVGL